MTRFQGFSQSSKENPEQVYMKRLFWVVAVLSYSACSMVSDSLQPGTPIKEELYAYFSGLDSMMLTLMSRPFGAL